MTEIVTLRTGKQVAEGALKTTMVALRTMADSKPIALIELVATCRDPAHVLWGGSAADLKALGMIEGVYEDGTVRVHDVVRDVVLAATDGDDLTLALVSPLEPAP